MMNTTANVATGTVSSKVITLTDGFGLLKKWDILNGNVEVLSVSSDLTRLTLSGTISDSSTAAAFYLAANESTGLVQWSDGATSSGVTNGGSYLPY